MPHYIYENGDFRYSDNPNYTTLPSYTTDYTTLGRNVFIKLDGQEKAVCGIINSKLECFKFNNYENERIHMQNVLGETNCLSNLCCSLGTDGSIDCTDSSSWNHCEVDIYQLYCVTLAK